MRLAMFTNKFPIKGDTFFCRDVRALLEAGIDVDIFPMHRIDPALWRWVPEILNDRVFPRDRVKGLTPRDALRTLRPGSLGAFGRFLGAGARIDASALRYGGGPLAKTSYILPLGWAWSRIYGGAYDHVMAYWGNYAATCAYVGHRLSMRNIPFSILLHAGTDLYRTQVAMEEKLLYADNVFVVCEFNREFLRTRFPDVFPRIEENVRLHHLGLDFAELPFTREGRKENLVLSVGRLDRNKGFDGVVRAAGALRRKGKDIEVEIIGDGVEAEPLRALARAEGIADRVRFPGWLPFAEVGEAMKRAALLVHPSTDIGDAVPTVIKEAEALGLPVIGTTVAGIPELLDGGKAGLLVPPRDQEALTAAVERFLGDGELRTNYACAGRRFAEEHFDLWKNGRALADRLTATKRGDHVPV